MTPRRSPRSIGPPKRRSSERSLRGSRTTRFWVRNTARMTGLQRATVDHRPHRRHEALRRRHPAVDHPDRAGGGHARSCSASPTHRGRRPLRRRARAGELGAARVAFGCSDGRSARRRVRRPLRPRGMDRGGHEAPLLEVAGRARRTRGLSDAWGQLLVAQGVGRGAARTRAVPALGLVGDPGHRGGGRRPAEQPRWVDTDPGCDLLVSNGVVHDEIVKTLGAVGRTFATDGGTR